MHGWARERQGVSPAAFFWGAARRRVLAGMLAAGAVVSRYLRPRRPYNVLRIELSGDLPEVETELRLRDLGRRSRTPDLVTLLAGLRSAREDPDLGLVLLDVHGLSAGWSRIQSLRRALLALRAAGKRVWVCLSQLGMRDYYLAAAADRVLLAPAALFDATGLASEVVFVKGALDKLGIEAQLARAGRFKSGAEAFTRTSMSPEHRAMVDDLLDDLYAQLVADIATARGLAETAVRSALAEGPLLAPEALRRGLVDALLYPDQVDAALEERFGDPAVIDFARYQRRRALAMRRVALRAPVVGLLSVSGPIGLADALPAASGSRTGSWRVFRREIDAMARDPRLEAIVLRVDSPGGSGLASDLMWREIVQARRAKPVLVSMGDVAASGGYYLAAAADHVTAEPATLTGSIGVLAGKPVLRGFYHQLGITKELVVRGNAARHSDYVPLDEADLGRLRAEADAFYDDFVAKVAAGRGLTPAAVEAIAEGRVWTGRQALERRLVDGLGGLEQTFDEVKRRLGLSADARLAVERRPRGHALWQVVLGRVLPAGGSAGTLAALDAAFDPLMVLAPVLAGERLLATMPFLLRFVAPGDRDGAGALAAYAGAVVASAAGVERSAGALRLVTWWTARLTGALRRPPVVLF